MSSAEAIAGARPRPSTARAAWVAWLGLVATCAIAFAIQLATNNAWIPDAYGFPGFTSPFALALGTVGTLIVSRRSSHRVGRVLLGAGALAALQSLYTEYAIASYFGPQGVLPGAPIAAWLLSWGWLPFVFLAGPLLLSIFPDGQFLSRRWRLVAVAVGIVGVLWAFLSAFRVGPLENFAVLENPFGFVPVATATTFASVLGAGMALGFVLPAASLVVRYRRSNAERRLQLKWIAAAGVVLAASAPAGFSLGKTGQLIFIVAFCLVPIATGIAILRYRLYEIDTIINRALVYGLLTAVIAGIYTASVGVMQRLSQTVAGADSQLTTVVATVLIVTAFTPMKSRLQALVDRRFKDAGDAKAIFAAFTMALHERTWAIDSRLALRRFAETAVAALRVATAEVHFEPPGGPSITARASGVDGGREAAMAWSTTATSGGSLLRLRVTADDHELSDRDRLAASEALEALGVELAGG